MMHTIARTGVLLASLVSGAAWSYGGGGGSSSCAEPIFYEPSSKPVVSSLSEFAFTISENTDTSSIAVEVNGQKIQPVVRPLGSGDWDVKVVLPQPITQPGKVQIGVDAKSRDGCWGFKPYYVEIKR